MITKDDWNFFISETKDSFAVFEKIYLVNKFINEHVQIIDDAPVNEKITAEEILENYGGGPLDIARLKLFTLMRMGFSEFDFGIDTDEPVCLVYVHKFKYNPDVSIELFSKSDKLGIKFNNVERVNK